MTLSSSPANPSGTPAAGCTFSETNALVSRSTKIPAVGIGLLETNAVPAAKALPSDAEMVRHIADCRYQMKLAEARFRGSHDLKDEQERKGWEALMAAAIRARQALYLERKAQQAADELSFAGDWAASIGRLDVSAQAVRRRMGGMLG